MPQPTGSDVHVNRPLTNILIGHMQSAEDFVAGRAFPNVPVQKQSDSYYEYSKADWQRSEIKKPRAPSTESEGSGWNTSTSTYRCEPYALHKDIDDQDRANQDDPIQLDRDAASYLGQQMLMKKELLWMSSYFTTSLWTGTDTGNDQTGVAAGPAADQFLQWNDASSTPIEDITAQMVAIKLKTGYWPNKLILGAQVWYTGLKNHPDILDRIKHTQKGVATTALLADLLEIEDVMVAKAVYNTANEGATQSNAFFAGKAALLCYAAPSPSIMMPSAGYTFSWNGYLAAGPLGQRITRFRMDALRSDRVEAEMAFDMKLVAADCGAFFTAAVA